VWPRNTKKCSNKNTAKKEAIRTEDEHEEELDVAL
jgi:hypothetical protein